MVKPLINGDVGWLLSGLILTATVAAIEFLTPGTGGILFILPEILIFRSERTGPALLIVGLCLVLVWVGFAIAGAAPDAVPSCLSASIAIVALAMAEVFREGATARPNDATAKLLRHGGGMLDRVIDGMREGLAVRDARGRLLFANSITRRFTGEGVTGDGSDYPAAGVTLTDPSTGLVVPPHEMPSSIALRGYALQDRELLLNAPHLEHPLPISVSAQPLFDESGAIEGCITWFRDISAQYDAELARRDAEAKLRQAQKMEAVGQLAGGIAHDFNNLLTVMVGNSEMLIEELDDDKAELRALAEQIAGAAARGSQLTHRLLAFSRRQPLKPSPIHINSMVTGMMPLLRRTLNEAIVIDEALDADAGTTLADGSNLENALLNLAVNARDAMPTGGRLGIRTRNTVIPAGRDDVMEGEYVLLMVSDTGTGMSDEVKARAFEPFFTTKEAGKGSGLGLATIYGFVRQSGGFVDIDSAPGVGTTITLGLPRVHVSGAETTHVVTAPHKGDGQLILVVEDDEFVRSTMVRVVGDLGYRAIAAPNAESCLEIIAQEHAIDLMITDVVMPGMNGWDLAKTVAEIRPGLPVLFTTGYTENVLLQRAGLDERIRVLSKPFKAGDLAHALEELLLSQRPALPSDRGLELNSEPQANT